MEDSDDGNITISSKASSGKSEQIRSLNDRLLRESFTRREADELYQKLQSEYDLLLAKHAQAENTIDQLRIAARVDLFSNGPIPHQAMPLEIVEFKSTPQPISISSPEKAVINWPRQTTEIGVGVQDGVPQLPYSEGKFDSNFIHRIKDLQNDIAAFQSALADRELSFEDQKNLFNALKDKHDRLKEQLTMAKEHNGESQGTSTQDRSPSHFVDPNSLEGELYRLELRLAEVCDDIGDQLFSNKQNDGALEQALRDDFNRMRLGSQVSDVGRQRTLSDHNKTSQNGGPTNHIRSSSDVSDRGHGGSASYGPEESPQRVRDKKEILSPSNEDLAESGYYASESMIRESPKRGSVNMPLRYLTRSRSPGAKDPAQTLLRRHWSLSELEANTESIDEVTLHSSDTDRTSFSGHGKARSANKSRSEHGYGNGADKDARQSRKSSLATVPKHGSASRHSVAGSSSAGPAATSSPLEENRVGELSPRDLFNLKEPADEVDANRSRPRKSRNDRATRASLSDRSLHENKSDGRLSSTKSGSRLSKTRPRQCNYSSSEESYPANRPDRMNSSVYSEQDKVPSLINSPKSKLNGTRHRPNTAESNLDSGFVGSEGTLKSQELSNGGRKKLIRPPRSKSEREDEIPLQQKQLYSPNSEQSVLSNEPVSSMREPTSQRRLSKSLRRDSLLDTVSEVTQESRQQPDSSFGSRIASDRRGVGSEEKLSNITRTPSGRLKEKSRDKGTYDDVISLQTSPETQTDASFIRLPVTVERSPFLPESKKRGNDDSGSLLNTASEKPRRSSNRSNTGGAQSGQKKASYDGFPFADPSEKQRWPTRERMDQSITGSKYSSASRRQSEQTDRLRGDLNLLRGQLAKLDQYRFQPDTRRRSTVRGDRQGPVETPHDESYDDIRKKLDELNHQLQNSLKNLQPGDGLNHTPHYQSDRDYEELKEKIDILTGELQRARKKPTVCEPEIPVGFSSPVRPLSQPTPVRELYGTREAYQTPTREAYQTPIRESQPSFTVKTSASHIQETSPTVIPVCPICSGVGYHKHGDYVFPRDFLESGRPMQIVPEGPAQSSDTYMPHRYKTSTPNGIPGKLETPRLPQPVTASMQQPSAIGYLVDTPSPYRSMPDLGRAGSSQLYPTPNTIHHIHTFHGQKRSRGKPSSSDSQSDDEAERQNSRNKRKSRIQKSRNSSRNSNGQLLDEYDDWRLDDALNEASRAACSMQRVSRRMLNNLATDLIRSGYSEY